MQQPQTLIKLGFQLFLGNEYDKAISGFQKVLNFPYNETENFKVEQATANMALGILYRLKCNDEKSIDHLDKALDISMKQDDLDIKAEAHMGFAHICKWKSDWENAIKHYEESLNFANKGHDKLQLSKAYFELGHIFIGSKDEQTSVYLNKSVEISSECHDTLSEAKALVGLGIFIVVKMLRVIQQSISHY